MGVVTVSGGVDGMTAMIWVVRCLVPFQTGRPIIMDVAGKLPSSFSCGLSVLHECLGREWPQDAVIIRHTKISEDDSDGPNHDDVCMRCGSNGPFRDRFV